MKNYPQPQMEAMIEQLEEALNNYLGHQYLIELQEMAKKDRVAYWNLLRGSWHLYSQTN